MITVRIPLKQQYAYIEATFDSTVEVNEQELYDLVARLDDAAPVAEPPAYTPRNDADRAPAERRQAPQRTPQRQQGDNRSTRFPAIAGWDCDICGGSCGVKPRTGRMRSDAVVCLGRCKDGDFVHTVGWLE